MKGRHKLVIQTGRVKYEMEFSRNITILKGDSASGKTTLVEMINEYNLNGMDTGINLQSDCPCRVIAGKTWMEQLSFVENSLVFIDEGNPFVVSEDFAKAVRGSSNYFIIVTRENLANLPYSVTEIYGIKSSGRYNSLEPVYHHMYRIYGNEAMQGRQQEYNLLIAEDSNAGFEFFSEFAKESRMECESAGGAGNLFEKLQSVRNDDTCLAIADGAAFGSQIEKVSKLLHKRENIQLYLPESFEWLVLSSGLIDGNRIRQILESPEDYIESKDYISWERFFTHLLVRETTDTYFQYTKSRLNKTYLQKKPYRQILQQIYPLQEYADEREETDLKNQ